MNLDPPPINNEVVGHDKQFSAPWKRSINQLYAFVKSFSGGGTGSGTVTNTSGPLPNHQVLVGNDGPDIRALPLMSDGQILIGQNANDPAPKNITGDGAISALGAFSLSAIGGVAGVYTNLNATIDSKGRVIVAANGSGGGVTLGFLVFYNGCPIFP